MKNLILSLIMVFLGFQVAVAHESERHDFTARAYSDGKNLSDFVKHAAAHLCEADSFGESLGLLNDFRKDEEYWKAGSTYLVLLSEKGGVFIHADNRALEDQVWSGLQDADGKNVGQEFLNLESPDPSRCAGETGFTGDGKEVVYTSAEGIAKKAYAFPVVARSVPFIDPNGSARFVLVGGFDYVPASTTAPATFAELVENLAEEISQPVSVIREVVTPEIDAMAVGNGEDLDSDKEELKRFVKGAFTLLANSFAQPQALDPVALRRVFRHEGGPWRSGSTYIYILDGDGNAIFNGFDRSREQTSVLNDYGPEITAIVSQILETAKKPDGGFVQYDWNDPADPHDDPPPGAGAGGSSPKLAYIKRFTFDKGDSKREPRFYVFGSGLYLGQEQKERGGDAGCAIAGADSTPKSSLLNLLLVGFAVLWLRRTTKAT